MIPRLGILPANLLPVSESASQLPSVSEAVTGLFRPLTIVRVRKTVVDFQVVESREEFRCMGSTQPLSSEDLVIKPEGERAWNWQRLHTTVDVDLGNDEIVLLRDTRYRVVGQSDYGAFGYVEYELVQDYGEECA